MDTPSKEQPTTQVPPPRWVSIAPKGRHHVVNLDGKTTLCGKRIRATYPAMMPQVCDRCWDLAHEVQP